MKIRHILLLLAAVLAIAFMQPLVTFLGGLTLLLGVGSVIFRDLPPASQNAVEHRVLGWLRRARAADPLPMADEKSGVGRKLMVDQADTSVLAQTFRRSRAKPVVRNAPSDATSKGANEETPSPSNV